MRRGVQHLQLDPVRIEALGAKDLFHSIDVTWSHHEGSGRVTFQQWGGVKWNVVSDWIVPDWALLRPIIEKSAEAYAKEKNIKLRAAADPSIGQIMQNHLGVAAVIRTVSDEAQKALLFAEVPKDVRFVNAFSELGSKRAADFETKFADAGEPDGRNADRRRGNQDPLTEIAIEATNKLFELAGTGSTLDEHNLDRHWRNARTYTLHDPVRWKYAIVGNHALNGADLPLHAWS